MNKRPRILQDNYFLIVVFSSLLIAVLLAWATRDIRCWPSDSCRTYIPAASRLSEITFPSQMHGLLAHDLARWNMRGKEVLIYGIAFFQGLFNDRQGLYPNVLLLIGCLFICAVVAYLNLKNLLDSPAALLGAGLLMTCFSPHMYALLGAHQPLVLMNFLLTVFFMCISRRRNIFFLLAGVCLGLMFFSSPTAFLYLPYLAGVAWWLYRPGGTGRGDLRVLTGNLVFFFCGATGVFLFFTLPHPWVYLMQFKRYLLLSQAGNHFGFYFSDLKNIFPVSGVFRGGGWPWVLKYFMLVMPVVFAGYLVGILYLFKEGLHKKELIGLALITLSTPFAVEISQVAQFGRNYFSWLVGIIFLVTYVFYLFKRGLRQNGGRRKLIAAAAVFFLAHAVFNVRVFLREIYPTRMATARLYRWLKDNNVRKVLAYREHFNNLFAVDVLSVPPSREKIRVFGIGHIRQPRQGLIIVPPLSGNNIWQDCVRDDFAADPFLLELYQSGQLHKYAVAMFKPVITSRIWTQEEEVCTYRDLMLGHMPDYDNPKNYIYVLDAARIPRAWP